MHYTFKTNCFCFLSIALLITAGIKAQETNSHVSGKVLSEKKTVLVGATVTLVHEPTQNHFKTTSKRNGYFHLFHVKPGGPYTIIITYSGYETAKKTNLYFSLNYPNQFFALNNNETKDFVLQEKSDTLPEIIVKSNAQTKDEARLEINIKDQKIQSLPSISRNLQDFIRLVPQAKVDGDGMISLAGQNSRFNAFFIDGANNNDVLGLAQSGTNGGQTGSPPISIDAIEEIKVMLAPYNVQYSNFTGGSINAITRSGTNDVKASAWYYFRNEQLAGRSPFPTEKLGAPGIFERPRLSKFLNQTSGIRVQGPVIKNKLFYFLLFEKQSEIRPQPFNIGEYRGSANTQQLDELKAILLSKYAYDAGSYLQSTDELRASRIVAKFDWNPSAKNKFIISYRYNNAQRTSSQMPSGNTLINFANNGSSLPTTTHSASFEWKRFFGSDISNRFLVTVNRELDDRKWMSKAFPRVSIADGPGSIVFGSPSVSGLSKIEATDINLSNTLKLAVHRHSITTGVDLNSTSLIDANIPSHFGSYQFNSINAFVSGAGPTRFIKSFSQLDIPEGDKTISAARFKTFRSGLFLNDDIRLGSKLNFSLGLRLDNNFLLANSREDKFFNDTALNIISKYYDLEGARAGQTIKPHWQVSPRVGFTYKLPKHKIVFQGGGGIFTGHMLNVWGSVLHHNNGVSIGSININPQQYGVGFNPDPYNQPTAQSLGINPAATKGELNLVAKNVKYPTVFRSSVTALKTLKKNWVLSVEGIFTQNIYEAKYTNVNILPPKGKSSSPGGRNVYSLATLPVPIPLAANGANPYTGQIYLLSNNHGKKGSSYSLSLVVDKSFNTGVSLNASYTYGRSRVIFEPSLNNAIYSSQWRQVETVNGKNFNGLSDSDADLRHRIVAHFEKKFEYSHKKLSTTVTLFYNGQSGSPYSYVYLGSMVNDVSNNHSFDLIYIPTIGDLANTNFIATTDASAEQQKENLDMFIENDKYLSRHRGKFAKRNGARLPFTHVVDLRIQQAFRIKVNRKETSISITYDVFNFTNMLNKNWGRTYFMNNDNYPLIRFAGFNNTTTLTPQYQFTGLGGTPYSIQPSTLPGNSARWISQLGFRISLN